MRRLFVSSPLTIAMKVHNFTTFDRKIMYETCGEKITFHRLSYIFFRFFLDPGLFVFEQSPPVGHNQLYFDSIYISVEYLFFVQYLRFADTFLFPTTLLSTPTTGLVFLSFTAFSTVGIISIFLTNPWVSSAHNVVFEPLEGQFGRDIMIVELNWRHMGNTDVCIRMNSFFNVSR